MAIQELRGGGGGHPRYASFPLILKATDNRYANALNAAPLTTVVSATDRMDFVPIVFPIDFTASVMSFEVTSGSGEQTLRFALYGADQNTSLPTGAPIYSDEAALANAVGVRSRTINQFIQGGAMLWAALWTQSATTFVGVDYLASLPLNIGGGAGASPNTLLRGSATYASSGAWPAIPTLTPTRAIVPLVRLRDSGF